jgi:hypothetical protein
MLAGGDAICGCAVRCTETGRVLRSLCGRQVVEQPGCSSIYLTIYVSQTGLSCITAPVALWKESSQYLSSRFSASRQPHALHVAPALVQPASMSGWPANLPPTPCGLPLWVLPFRLTTQDDACPPTAAFAESAAASDWLPLLLPSEAALQRDMSASASQGDLTALTTNARVCRLDEEIVDDMVQEVRQVVGSARFAGALTVLHQSQPLTSKRSLVLGLFWGGGFGSLCHRRHATAGGPSGGQAN